MTRCLYAYNETNANISLAPVVVARFFWVIFALVARMGTSYVQGLRRCL